MKLLFIALLVVLFGFSGNCAEDIHVGWVRSGRGSDSDYSKSICLGGRNAVFWTGSYWDSVSFGNVEFQTTGQLDSFLLKIDASGNFVKTLSFGGTGNDGGRSLAYSKDGSLYVVGTCSTPFTIGSLSITNGNLFLAKFDSDLNVQWVRSMGGSDAGNTLEGVATDGAGVVIHGYFGGTITVGGSNYTSVGDYDLMTARYSSDGTLEWCRAVGGTGREYAYSIAMDEQGFTYVAGTFQGTVNFGGDSISAAGGYDAYLAKYDLSGNVVFAESFGGSGNDNSAGVAVAGDKLYLTGSFNGTASFGTNSLSSSGETDGFILSAKLDGSINWCRSFGSTGEDQGRGVKFDHAGRPLVLGLVSGTCTFGSLSVTSAGNYDMAIGRLTLGGTFDKVWRIGGANVDAPGCLAVDDDDQMYVCGAFTTQTEFGPVTITSKGGYDVFAGLVKP